MAPAELHQKALSLSTANNLAAVYDAQCVALAELLACELWTADRRLVRELAGKVSNVKAFSDFHPGPPIS
ncbi:MAG: hypothetical protein ACRDHX_08045 [Chloroflexota bacterium]